MYEVFLGFKYIVYTWAIGACLLIAYYSVQQEWLERRYPSPHEWSFITRLRFRLLRWGPDRNDTPEPNWVQIGAYAKNLLERLEDPKIDGAGLQALTEGGVHVADVGEAGYDVTGKSEPWRRGYYEVLMCCAKAAQQLDNHVLDTTRNIVFPADQVHGPSNPNPKPIPPGSPSAPNEKDCEPFYEAPETYFMQILTTRGFTNKQKMDTALEYGSWLDFKGIPEAAERMYEWALQLATENTSAAALPYDTTKYVLRDSTSVSSANVLTCLTAIAAHKARTGDLSAALPIFISVLRARRSLPAATANASGQAGDSSGNDKTPWTTDNILSTIKRLISPPAYPLPPPDGNSPPIRNTQGLCEEAGLNLYIGEIMYASGTDASGREDGLAWTREAVDIAEEQLDDLKSNKITGGEAAKTCKACLNTGLENWMKMASMLARAEKEGKESGASLTSRTWLGLWSSGQATTDDRGRWAAEENLVRERIGRAQELLDELDAPSSGVRALFSA